jgi:hypothetical protein
MVFDRYEELRIARHAVIHNNGVLSAKHSAKLHDLRDRLSPELRSRSLVNQPVLDTGEVHFGHRELFAFRKWFWETVVYLSASVDES